MDWRKASKRALKQTDTVAKIGAAVGALKVILSSMGDLYRAGGRIAPLFHVAVKVVEQSLLFAGVGVFFLNAFLVLAVEEKWQYILVVPIAVFLPIAIVKEMGAWAAISIAGWWMLACFAVYKLKHKKREDETQGTD